MPTPHDGVGLVVTRSDSGPGTQLRRPVEAGEIADLGRHLGGLQPLPRLHAEQIRRWDQHSGLGQYGMNLGF